MVELIEIKTIAVKDGNRVEILLETCHWKYDQIELENWNLKISPISSKKKYKEMYKLFLLFEINKFKILKVNIQKEIN